MKQNSRIQLENTLISALGVATCLFIITLPELRGWQTACRVSFWKWGTWYSVPFLSCSSSTTNRTETEARRLEHLLLSCCFKKLYAG